MRVIDQIPHPACRISIFTMNNKFLVKFEAGPYEQTYKFDQDDFNGVESLKAKISEGFIEQVIAVFRTMHLTAQSIETLQ
jgi:hypothetical protein